MSKRIHKPYSKLKGALKEREITYGDIAKVLSVSETSISNKINGQSDFSLCEVICLKEYLNAGNDIFLP